MRMPRSLTKIETKGLMGLLGIRKEKPGTSREDDMSSRDEEIVSESIKSRLRRGGVSEVRKTGERRARASAVP